MATMTCLVAALSLWGASPVAAQDDAEEGMEFGVDEVPEPADPNSPSAKFIEEGKRLYQDGKYPEASLIFYKVLQQEGPSAEVYYPEAEYEMGKTLFRMELYQGALSYFGRVVDAGETHPYYMPTLKGLVLLTEQIPSDPTLLSRLSSYSNKFPSDVPAKYRDSYASLVGRYLYSQGQYDEALKLLSYVKPGSEAYLNARYIAGVTHVGNYDAKQAVQAFKDVLRPLTTKYEEGTLNQEERKLLELTWLGMGRVFYSTGDYDTSVKYYDYIPRRSPLWPVALFESSWAFFQLDLANKALGNLHTLNSPFFAKSYFPEAPILSAVIFFYNCKYPRVRYELEEFEYAYLPLKDSLQEVIGRYEDPAEMYSWLNQLLSGELDAEEDEQLVRLLAASLDDKEVNRKIKLIETTQKELDRIEGMPSTWKDSALGGALIQDSTVAREFAISDTGELVRQRLERVLSELTELDVNKDRILIELEEGERGRVDAEIQAAQELQANVTQTEDIQVNDEQLYWTYEGEYWKDELGFYVFNINSECRR